MKQTIHHSLILSITLAASAAHATTVFTDTFASGTGSWYKASTTGVLSNSSERLSWAENGNNMAEAIGRSFTSQSISVGQTIQLTFDLQRSAGTTTGSTQIFRVGLFDVATAITAGNWADTNAIGAWQGYYTFVRDGNNSGNVARHELSASTSATVGPLNGGGTQATITSPANTTSFNINDNATVTYQGLFSVTRTSATQMTTLFTLSTTSGEITTNHFSVSGSHTASVDNPLTTSFDTVVFKDGANTPITYLDNVQLTVIPEPSAAALGAFGLLALLRRRRN